jgi:intracellular multiplication protein IcmM
MNRQRWTLIRSRKNFNVMIYRRALAVLIVALGLNGLWAVLMFLIYVNQPERDYFASNGEMPPIQLKPMLTPNYSPQALLEPDPQVVEVEKTIPQ